MHAENAAADRTAPRREAVALAELLVVDPLLECLGPRELCRLCCTSVELRLLLSASAAKHSQQLGSALWWDETTATGARLTSLDGRRALLVLGAQPAPSRVSAVASAQFVNARAHAASRTLVEWETVVHGLRAPTGSVLWVGLTYCADDEGGVLDKGGARWLLAPFEPVPSSRGGLAERFAASAWPIFALGSAGYAWGGGVGATAFGESWASPTRTELHSAEPDCAPVAVVRLRLDSARGELSVGLYTEGQKDAAPMRVIARRVFRRGAPLPTQVYAICHLTDIVARAPVVAPAPEHVIALARATCAALSREAAASRARRGQSVSLPGALSAPHGATHAQSSPAAADGPGAAYLRALCAFADVELRDFRTLPADVPTPVRRRASPR
ncbi:hypothetical protein T492DRAFT_1027511 [Pavlovales sp. CCMP2436]|nr:hypothetical protein T492DRAFT_1027511 [Pavlovales sp. CCMP2436]